MYRVDAQGPTLQDKIDAANVKMQNLSPDDALDPMIELTAVYSEPPPRGTIHIFVQVPPSK
jgi:hypothetical protein